MSSQIGFLGCGKMAQALAAGFVRSGTVRADQIAGSDVVSAARSAFTHASGCAVVEDNLALVRDRDVVILAVKPQSVEAVLTEVRNELRGKHLLVSIAAGVTLSRLRQLAGHACRLVRVMPNTPCLVGAGAIGIAPGPNATEEDIDQVEQLMSNVGIVHRVGEGQLDAVTGLSGSGPAFVYQMIEALSDGGVLAGLGRDVSTSLAAQTVLGAAKMVLETGLHPGQLKDMVTSPGGTTIEGLSVLESHGVRGAYIEAVEAATRRSKELGSENG